MRSCATRSTNWNGPEHTGLAPNLSPAACAAFGDTIIPARSASAASSGENGADRLRRTVIGSTTSTAVTGASSPRRLRARHRLVPLDVVLDRGGVELLAVVEGDAGAELDRQRLAVGRPFVARRELRHDVELLVDVERACRTAPRTRCGRRTCARASGRARPDPRRGRSAASAQRRARPRAPRRARTPATQAGCARCASWRLPSNGGAIRGSRHGGVRIALPPDRDRERDGSERRLQPLEARGSRGDAPSGTSDAGGANRRARSGRRRA